MKLLLAFVLGGSLASGVLADSLDLPMVKPGDTWVYRNTTEKAPNGWSETHDELTVLRITSSGIYASSKQAGANQSPREFVMGLDWSRVRDVNGKETTVNQPLSFPLITGKKWQIQYTEQHPNKMHRYEEWSNSYRVVGYETVEVPAGKFNALKIESEGKWTAQVEPTNTVVQGSQATQNNTTMVTQVNKTTADLVGGRTYRAFWYVPEVKRWVKSVEEYFGSNGSRDVRYSSELESFKAGE